MYCVPGIMMNAILTLTSNYLKKIISKTSCHMTSCDRISKYTLDQDIMEIYKYYSDHCKPVNRLLYEEISRSNILFMYTELCTDIQTSIKNHLNQNTTKILYKYMFNFNFFFADF